MPHIWVLFRVNTDPQEIYDDVVEKARGIGRVEEVYFSSRQKNVAYALVETSDEDPGKADGFARKLPGGSADVLLDHQEQKRKPRG